MQWTEAEARRWITVELRKGNPWGRMTTRLRPVFYFVGRRLPVRYRSTALHLPGRYYDDALMLAARHSLEISIGFGFRNGSKTAEEVFVPVDRGRLPVDPCAVLSPWLYGYLLSRPLRKIELAALTRSMVVVLPRELEPPLTGKVPLIERRHTVFSH